MPRFAERRWTGELHHSPQAGEARVTKEGTTMRTVAIINQKGGCGKTTSAINLSACLARLNQKTLLVDMDPQGHCGTGLAVPEEQVERTIYDAMLDPSDTRDG